MLAPHLAAFNQLLNVRNKAIGMKHTQNFNRFDALQRLYEISRHDHALIFKQASFVGRPKN